MASACLFGSTIDNGSLRRRGSGLSGFIQSETAFGCYSYCIPFVAKCLLGELAGFGVHHGYGLLSCVQIAAYNFHLSLLRPEPFFGCIPRSHAASRSFITRTDSGKKRLNTSYFLGVLTSVAIHTAYRPYWTRSS